MAGACTCRWRGESTDAWRNSRWPVSFSPFLPLSCHRRLSASAYQLIDIASVRLRVPESCLRASNTRSSLIEEPVSRLHVPHVLSLLRIQLVGPFLFRRSARRDTLGSVLPGNVAVVTQTGHTRFPWLVVEHRPRNGKLQGDRLRKHHPSAFERAHLLTVHAALSSQTQCKYAPDRRA